MREIFGRIWTDRVVGAAVLLWLLGLLSSIGTHASSAHAFDVWDAIGTGSHALLDLGAVITMLYAKPPAGPLDLPAPRGVTGA